MDLSLSRTPNGYGVSLVRTTRSRRRKGPSKSETWGRRKVYFYSYVSLLVRTKDVRRLDLTTGPRNWGRDVMDCTRVRDIIQEGYGEWMHGY